jgi:hypothetical protein
MFPKVGPLWKQTPISRAILNKYFGVPSYGVLPPGCLRGFPPREMTHCQSPSSYIFRSPQYMNLPQDSRFSSAVKGPLQRFPYPKPFLHLPGSPVKEAPLKALSLSLFRERRSIPRAPFIFLSKYPVDVPSNRFPSGHL